MTLRHLLSHTHGLTGTGIAYRLAYTGEHDPATLWRLLAPLRPNREAPLGTYRYTNLGYNIAAMLIERRTGRRWQDIVEREVFGRSHDPQPDPGHRGGARGASPSPCPIRQTLPRARRRSISSSRTIRCNRPAASSPARTTWPLPSRPARRRARPGHGPAAGRDDRRHASADRHPQRKSRRLPGAPATASAGIRARSTGPRSITASAASPARARTCRSCPRATSASPRSPTTTASARSSPTSPRIYAYAWFAEGRDAAAATGEQWLGRVDQEFARRRARIAAARAEQAARPWRLSQPIAAYVGRYCNDDYGTITDRRPRRPPVYDDGPARAMSTPFDRPETVRVEPIAGEGILLEFEAGGRAGGGAEHLGAALYRAAARQLFRRHCEERSRRTAIQGLFSAHWIASLRSQ